MRKRIIPAILALAMAITMIFPARALAIPAKFRNCPSVTKDGVTYLLYKRCAIVRKTPNRKTVTIPRTIRVKGKTYGVRAIWDHTFEMTPKLRTVILKADVECIEDPAIFTSHRIKVKTNSKDMYKWLKRGGVNVTYVKGL